MTEASDKTPALTVAGLEYRWDLERGTFSIGGFPCTAFFRDSSLARLMLGFLTMVGPRRFSLALQAEGQRGIDQDWQIIAAHPSFEEGYADLSRYAYTAGWGRWELVELDRTQKTALFRVHSSWEGELQKAVGVNYGAGLVAGKMAGLCSKLFESRCWPRQTMFIAEGDDYDEIVVEASERSLDDELRELAAEEQATSTDLHKLLAEIKASAAARESALADRDRMVRELEDKVSLIEQQRQAIAALSTPIIQLWDEVLAVPVVGVIDGDRTARMMEKLLEAIIGSKARFAILDVTGVDTIDTTTADNFVRIIRAVQLLGAQGVISGIGPLVAQTIVDLGVDLTRIRTFSNLREALRACIAAPRRAAKPAT
jgi:rsbT co-antagonist protein RsbR